MGTLKLGAIAEEKPVKLTIELPAALHRDLIIYGTLLARETGEASAVEPSRLVPAMLTRFMATDRGFLRLRRSDPNG